MPSFVRLWYSKFMQKLGQSILKMAELPKEISTDISAPTLRRRGNRSPVRRVSSSTSPPPTLRVPGSPVRDVLSSSRIPWVDLQRQENAKAKRGGRSARIVSPGVDGDGGAIQRCNVKQRQHRKRAQSSRPTHFLCFPLVTSHAIPQLAESYERFRRLTLRTAQDEKASWDQKLGDRDDLDRERGHDVKQESDQAHDESTTHGTAKRSSQSAENKLKIIPSGAHRPLGSMHLTIGTMTLHDRERKQKALKLLKEVDFRSLVMQAQIESQKRSEQQHQHRQEYERLTDTAATDDEAARTTTPARESVDDTVMPRDPTGPDTIIPTTNNGETESTSPNSLNRPISPPLLPPAPPSETTQQLSHPSSIPNQNKQQQRPAPQDPISITLHSLSTFPQPQSARVFYAIPHDPTSRLQHLAESIQRVFLDEGVLDVGPHGGRPLILHATVANMIYANAEDEQGDHHRGGVGWKGGAGGGKGRRAKRKRKGGVELLDARDLVDYFSSSSQHAPIAAAEETEGEGVVVGGGPAEGFIWASDVVVDRVRICKMGATKIEDSLLGMVYPAIDNGEAEVRF